MVIMDQNAFFRSEISLEGGGARGLGGLVGVLASNVQSQTVSHSQSVTVSHTYE